MNHSNGITQVIGTCEMKIFTSHDAYEEIKLGVSVQDTSSIDYGIWEQDGYGNYNPPADVSFNVTSAEFKLEFNFALNFNNTYEGYDPRNSGTYKNIEDRIIELLTNYPYNNISGSNFFNKLKLTGEIKGENGMKVTFIDKFN